MKASDFITKADITTWLVEWEDYNEPDRDALVHKAIECPLRNARTYTLWEGRSFSILWEWAREHITEHGDQLHFQNCLAVYLGVLSGYSYSLWEQWFWQHKNPADALGFAVWAYSKIKALEGEDD